MPIITEQDAIAQTPLLPTTVAPTPPQTPESPSALDTAAAAFRQSNILSSVTDRYLSGGYTNYPAQPGYDVFANNGAEIRGFEDYADRFTRSTSPEQTQQIRNQISQELADKAVLSRAGVPGYITSLAAGATDPITLTSMLLPGAEEVAATRLGRIGATVATNVAAGEAQAGALAANSQTTNYSDGILPRVGANALLAGVLGSIATRVPRAELDAVTARTAARLAPESSTAGAAAVPVTSLADESIAAGGRTIAKTVGRISPVTRIFANSEVVEARQLAQQLVDPGFMLEKNLRGIATPTSVEMRVNQMENARNAQLFQKFDSEFASYKMDGGTLSKPEFSAAVADAMRNGDTHEIPQVQKVAQFTRPMFQADRKILSELGVMPEGDNVVGAQSYFPRVYDQHAIMASRTDIEQRLHDWFTQNPKIDEKTGLPIEREPAEVKGAVYDTLDRIQGTVRGTADIGQGLRNPSVVKGRSLDVPDSILHPYLSHDFEHVMSSYNRAVLPQIEMRRTFGSTGLEQQMRAVTDAYHVKIEYAGSDEAKAALVKQQSKDMADLALLRDRVLNQTGPRGNDSLTVVRAAQLVRSFNYLRMLGGQTLSAIPDVGRLVTRYGLVNTSRRLAAFLSGLDQGLSKADAQRMGTALDTVLHTRQHTLEGIGDEMAGSQLSERLHNLTANFTKITGIAAWDSMMRTLSSQLEQDALYRLVNKGNVSTLERGKLAAHGIGEAELPAIREQWMQHGTNENGLNRARTELWTDKDAAARVEQAVQRAGSSNAFFVGKGDLPGFANSWYGKCLLQFKSFAISSVNRLAIPLAQGLAHRDVMAANGLASMLALGALTFYVKELAAGRQPDLSPDSLIPEAVQRSGVLAFAPDLYDPLAGSLHLPRFAKFQDLNPLETMAGATFGTGANALDVVRRISKGNISAADIHKLRQLMPYQNLFYLTRLVNMLEGKTADAIGAKNAPGKSVADYFNPAQDDQPKFKADRQHLFGAQSIPNAF